MAAVQSVERSFALLETMADSEEPLGVSGLAEASGLPLATVHRLLRTLVDLGYVRQEPDRTYALSPRLIRLGERAATGLAEWSRPLLQRLARTLGESANLAALEGDQVVYLAHVPSAQSVRMFTEVGRRAPAPGTGVGKAMLAELPEAEMRALLVRAPLRAVTSRTVTDPDLLADQLGTVRERGYAIDDEEQELGVRCVAVAVPGRRLAVSISGPSSRVDDELVAAAVPLLREVASAIAEEFSYRAEST